MIRLPYFTESILTRSLARPKLLFACKRDDGNVCFFSSSQPQNPDQKSSPVAGNYHMTFHLEGGGSWQLYSPLQGLVYGFKIYYGIACFDIRSEKFEFIEKYVLISKLVNYMGKLATLKWDNEFDVISGRTKNLELCVLEDAKKLEWSTRTFVLPASWNNLVADFEVCILGVTRTGEIVLSHSTDPFFLIYYNLDRNTLTKVDIQGMDAFKHCNVHTYLDHVEDVKLGGVFRTT
ncbi:unnamed protein product [Microthlaspi erraticum]|uniref:F-box associated beta-propeller type 3 domain-containing protein n=1 Tax=Microthlaspi erraticum TaxID=1685480 RepID=A0A6D2KEZ4_9BRAS|nr:unnamed protein product [Microthlaspi erraticum]